MELMDALVKNIIAAMDTRLANLAWMDPKTRQAARSADWGYAGDLGRITEQLANVLAGLGDASAAGARGLAY